MVARTKAGDKLTPAELHKLTVEKCRKLPGYSELTQPDKNRTFAAVRADIVRELMK